MLKDKTVVLGVTGSIAAYKMANVASLLIKQHCDVHVIMTENATKFIHPITFETLTNHKCLVETFDRNFQFHVAHVSLGQKADCMLIAPASGNVIGKLANGIADDMLTTTAMAATCPKIVAPAMNTQMFLNPVVQDNLEKLSGYGYEIVVPVSGRLACGDVGAGKLPDEQTLVDYIFRSIAREKDMAGKKVLVTAGPTRESLDPVRFLSNRSSGKMGYAIAKMAMLRGADVTLVSGPVNIPAPPFVNVISVESAEEMFQAVKAAAKEQDIFIKAAAVADYRPETVSGDKIKKKDEDMSIPLTRTTDIIKYLGEHKQEGQFICGFSMETKDMLENSKKKLVKKNMDMIVANNVKESGAGFATDTNKVTFITEEEVNSLPLMTKEEVADCLLTEIMKKI